MKPETEAEFLDRRLEQMREAATEAIRREVAWLREHNFPVWVYKNGRVVDAREEAPERPDP